MNFPTGGRGLAFWFLIGLFAVASVINVIAGFFEQDRIRKLTKPFCMLFLGSAAAVAVPFYPLIYVGAFMGMIGDVFLIFKKNQKMVIVGILAFYLGHLCYFAAMLSLLFARGYVDPWPYNWIWILLYAVLTPALFWHPTYLLTRKKIFSIYGAFYMDAVVSEAIVPLLLYSLFDKWDYFYLCAMGGVLFCISDLILTYTLFKKDLPRRDSYIMFTYLGGQFFIILGLILSVLR
jgi:uncharacterized membrane protein YhhN